MAPPPPPSSPEPSPRRASRRSARAPTPSRSGEVRCVEVSLWQIRTSGVMGSSLGFLLAKKGQRKSTLVEISHYGRRMSESRELGAFTTEEGFQKINIRANPVEI